jgi:acetyl esterase/lipase
VAGQDTLVFPRNSQRLAAALQSAGVSAEVRTYPELGHIGILTALARPFRGRAPVVRDIAGFARAVTRTPASSAAATLPSAKRPASAATGT